MCPTHVLLNYTPIGPIEEYFRFLLTHSRYNWDRRNDLIGDTSAGSLLWPADIAFGRQRFHSMDGNK